MSRALILKALEDGPATSYEIHIETGLKLAICCATLAALANKKRVVKSTKQVRLRKQSPGAWLYTLPPECPKHAN